MDVTGQRPLFAFKHKVEGWGISTILGGSARGMSNLSTSASIPLTQWRYWGEGEWKVDPELKISRDLGSPCGNITITATGRAATVQSACLGVYKPTDKYSAGRKIFKQVNGGKVLMVRLSKVGWGIQDNVNKCGSFVSYMISACAPSLCPADTRAETSGRLRYIYWQYLDEDWKHGDITVKCSAHSK